MPSKSLLFVPDITGFTKFVNNTEIDHSQHIISELLENIIDSNQLDLEVSEIEGDAVFFYKENEVPGLNEVYEQAKKMFLNFHSHLKLYESQRICQCGACSSASELSLKFIVHSGEIGFTNIKNNRKPFGTDIVLLHKLLKNNISQGEYILFTHHFLEDVKNSRNPVSVPKLENGVDDYADFGPINYTFTSLSNLYDLIPDPPPVVLPAKMKNPFTLEHVFDLPLLEVYEYLSNFDLKKKWNEGVNEFKFERGKVNRVGTKHICLFDRGKAEFESITNDFGEGNLVYGEKLLKFPLANDFTFYFILSPQEDKTKIRVEIHYKPLPVIGWLLKPIIRMNINKINRNFVNAFSKLEKINKLEDSFVVI
jgi:hypothetical protein